MIQILPGRGSGIRPLWQFGAILAGTVFCSVTPAADSPAGAFQITSGGQAKAEIVVEVAQPEPPIAFAAQELQRYVREITGATLPIVRAPSGKPHIILITSPLARDSVREPTG